MIICRGTNDTDRQTDGQIFTSLSFMSDSVLKELDKKLKDIGNRTHIFGGFSIYFQETFVNSNLFVVTKKNSYFQVYQVESGKTTLMWYSYLTMNIASKTIHNMDKCWRECGPGIYPKKIARWWTVESLDTMVFNFHLYLKVSKPKTFVINPFQKKLNNNYSFPNWKTWQTFYSELEIYDLLMLSCYFQGDICYAYPTNKERNAIQKALFRKHINTTHPSITSNKLPPNHTLIIEANISSSVSKKSKHKIDRHLKNCILTTCGDADGLAQNT